MNLKRNHTNKIFALIVLFSLLGSLFFLGSAPVFAALTAEDLSAQIDQLENKIDQIQTTLKTVLDNQQTILKKLDTLRIVARRS